MELKVTVLNINSGYNAELLGACQTLKEYTLYVERVRKYIKELPLEEAVDRAIDECIKENILIEFLVKYRAEARDMCIFEYDEEAEIAKIKKMEREDEREIVLREIEKIKRMEREDEREIVLKEIEKIKKMEREDEREIILKENEKRLINQVYKKIIKSKSLEQTVDELEGEMETIKPIYEAIKSLEEDFNCDVVYEKLHK